ncbi:MAG: hypothetical protein QOJ40_808 [Verrucomicrobiota bacterium]
MPNPSRRKFLKQTGLGLAGVSMLPSRGMASAFRGKPNDVPGHQGMLVPAVHGYAAQSVCAGQTLNFHISSTVPHRLTICRLGHNAEDTTADEILHRFPVSTPSPQPIHPGSYIYVPKQINEPLTQLTLECWVRPAKLKARQGLFSQCDEKNNTDFGLFINPDGTVSFSLGETPRSASASLISTAQLKPNRWQHIAAVWDGTQKQIWFDGKLSGSAAFQKKLIPGQSILRLAASGHDGVTIDFLDGDLAMPIIHGRALGPEEIAECVDQRALVSPKGKATLAGWTFSEEKGTRVGDNSRNGRHGQIINHATWMVGGPSFDYEVSRFARYEPEKDVRRGHGLRFCSDDLYDCGWEATHEYTIPRDSRSGVYAGRIEYEWEGKPHLYHVTFIVKRPPRRAKAPLLVLCSTNTWRAYNATPFAKPDRALKRNFSTQGAANFPGEPPAFCFYRRHAAGQGCYQLGLNMPFVGGDPYLLYGKDYSHLARAERFAQIWLERAGYKFDLITDLDLHREPGILHGYKTLLINGHSEYWSRPAYFGVEQYLKHGGNAIVLSGNTMLWRVSFNDDCSIIECRKVDAPGEQMKPHERGECWHSHDGIRGGFLRETDYPGYKLFGLDMLGFAGESGFGPYTVENADHFFYHVPEETGLKAGDEFGQAPDGGFPRANGHEVDIRMSTFAALQETPSPAGASMPADPPGITRIANGTTKWSAGSAFDYFFRPIKPAKPQGAEMIYWERPDGGKVFNAGAIGSGWALNSDPKFQTLMRNVLFHFGIKPA